MKKYRLPLACALVVLLSLALPFAVFSLWDKALLSAPHSQTSAEGLSAEARANSTACTLYACSHVLNVPLGYNSGSENPWAQTAIDDATLDRARSALRALHDAGLLTDVQLAKALAVCTQNDKATTWNAATAPGGLTQVSCNVIGNFDDESPDSYSSFALNLILTSADTPVYFNYQDGQDTTHLIADAAYLQVQHPFGAGFLCRLAVPGLESRRAGFRRRRLQRDRTALPHLQLPLWHHPICRQHDPAGLR